MTLPNPRPLSYRQVINYLDHHRQLVQTAQVDDRYGQIVIDSRQVTAGDIFLALNGIDDDGNNYLAEAEANGAGLCLSDQPRNSSQTTTIVKNSRLAWSQLCSLAYDHPENQLKLIGVTGTNGKSSTTWMLNQMLSLSGYRSMLIGGLGIYCGEQLIAPNPLTTPDPDLLYRLLAYAHQQNISHVVMEVSSHAIALQKVMALTFDACIFTSFSQDHLDFHQTLEDYFRCKWQFIEQNRNRSCLIALDDKVYQRALLDGYRCQHPNLWCYGHELTNQPPNRQTMRYKISKLKGLNAYAEINLAGQTVSGWVNFFANHAVGNFAVSLLTVHQLSLTRGELFQPKQWMTVGNPPGRLEVICQTPLVVVDYAHTPEALALSLKSLSFAGQLTVVFGCGGGRDRQKRQVMGRVAEQLAERIILTNDNPRDENPATIVEDICEGITNRSKVITIHDRRLAIERAIHDTGKDGAVLVAGKGCEDYQEIDGQRLAFDDRLVCRSVLAGD